MVGSVMFWGKAVVAAEVSTSCTLYTACHGRLYSWDRRHPGSSSTSNKRNALAQQRHHGLRHQDGAEEVDVHHPAQVFGVSPVYAKRSVCTSNVQEPMKDNRTGEALFTLQRKMLLGVNRV